MDDLPFDFQLQILIACLVGLFIILIVLGVFELLREKYHNDTGKPWYRSFWFKIFTFLFFLPAWAVIILTDKDERVSVKILAILWVVIAMTICCCNLFYLLYNQPLSM